jgi:hypothetical protein
MILFVLGNPENDPFGVEIESTYSLATFASYALIRNFPLLESYSMGVGGITTLLNISGVRICLAWSCFNASNLQRGKNVKISVSERDRQAPAAHRSGGPGDSI